MLRQVDVLGQSPSDRSAFGLFVEPDAVDFGVFGLVKDVRGLNLVLDAVRQGLDAVLGAVGNIK